MTDVGGLHRQRGLAASGARRYELAEQEFRAALASDPTDAAAAAYLSDVLRVLGRPEEALQHGLDAVRLGPQRPVAWYVLGRAQLALARADDARDSADRLLAIDPSYQLGYVLWAVIAEATRQDEEVLEVTARGLALVPEDTDLLNLRQRALLRLGRIDEAAATSQEVLRLQPESAIAHESRGLVLLDQHRPREAAEAFSESLRIEPGRKTARRGLAEALKSRHRVYALLLRFLLWSGRPGLGARFMMPAIIGSWLLLRAALGSGADTGPLRLSIVLVVFAAVWLMWVSPSLFDLLLRFDPVGRAVLSQRQVQASNALAVLLSVAIPMGIVALITGAAAAAYVSVGALMVSVPVVAALGYLDGRPRALMIGLVVVIGGLFAGAAALGARAGMAGFGEGLPANVFWGSFVLCIAASWLGYVLVTPRGRRPSRIRSRPGPA